MCLDLLIDHTKLSYGEKTIKSPTTINRDVAVIKDIHCCGDCTSQFKNLEEFVVHKLQIEKCTLTLEDSGIVPGLKVPIFSKIESSNEIIKPTKDSNDIVPPVEEDEVYGVSELSEEEMMVDSPTEALKIDEHLPSPQVTTNENENTEDRETEKEDNEAEREDNQIEKEDNESDKEGSTVKCLICGHRYKNGIILKVHERTVHSVARPYSCNICSVAFKTKGSLTRHQRRHTDERPYKCTTCGKSFRESGSLTRHLKSIVPCSSLYKTLPRILDKHSKETTKTQKTLPRVISAPPKPTSVNVLITRVKSLPGDKDTILDDKVIATVINEIGDKSKTKVVEIKLKQSDIKIKEEMLVISDSD